MFRIHATKDAELCYCGKFNSVCLSLRNDICIRPLLDASMQIEQRLGIVCLTFYTMFRFLVCVSVPSLMTVYYYCKFGDFCEGCEVSRK